MADASTNPVATAGKTEIARQLAEALIEGPFPGERKNSLTAQYAISAPLNDDAALAQLKASAAGFLVKTLELLEARGDITAPEIQNMAIKTIEKATRKFSERPEFDDERATAQQLTRFLNAQNERGVQSFLPENAIGTTRSINDPGVKVSRVMHTKQRATKFGTGGSDDGTPSSFGGGR